MDGLTMEGGVGAYKKPKTSVEAYGSDHVVSIRVSPKFMKPSIWISMFPLA